MALTNENLKEQLVEKFGDKIFAIEEPYGLLSFETHPSENLKVLTFLKEELGFNFLTDITGIHFPNRKEAELGVVYHLHNLKENIRVRFKVFVPKDKPDVFTATSLFVGANWMERETYDFFGFNFIGHPNLKRVLNVEEMDYFPLRKEYPLEDQTRIDKDDAMFGR